MKDYTNRPVSVMRGHIDMPQPDPAHWADLPCLTMDERGRIEAQRTIEKPKRQRPGGAR